MKLTMSHHLTFRCFQVLLRAHADKYAINRNGDSPLSVAAFFGHDSIVAQLLEHQSSAQSPSQANAALYHNFVRANEDNYTPLMLASAGGHIAVVHRLLQFRHKLKILEHLDHVSIVGQTAASLAAHYGHVQVVQLLAEEGAHLNLADHLKRTPLLLAIERGDVRLVEILFVLGTSCVECHKQKI
jgi:ankyrin repeat protein